MAAAMTVTTGYPKSNVNGSFRELYYKGSIAADADYLDVPMRTVNNVTACDDTLTAIGVASIAQQGYGSRITFNSGGAITGMQVRVTGH